MIRAILAGAALLSLGACATEPPKTAAVNPKIIQPDCRTVRPYKPLDMRKPGEDVPEMFKQFAGFWGGGAWDGAVCHDLWVMRVDEEGQVVMFDAHGPGFGYDATGFQRKGRIDRNGRLHVRKGPAEVEYWIKDGQLHGVRKHDGTRARIILSRKS